MRVVPSSLSCIDSKNFFEAKLDELDAFVLCFNKNVNFVVNPYKIRLCHRRAPHIYPSNVEREKI
jgi:hypothetical protein